MPLIVDTYNVLHVVGILPPEMAGIDTLGLIDLLRSSRHAHEKTTLVCDGIPHEHAPQGRFGPIIIKYAGSNRLADDVITSLVDGSSVPRRLSVVSSDREIIRAARRRRCKCLSSEEFLRQLVHDAQRGEGASRSARPSGDLSDDEVQEWAAEFGLDDGTPLPQTPDLPQHLRPLPPPPATVEPTDESSGKSSAARRRTRDRKPKPAETDKARLSSVDCVPADILAEAERLLEAEAAMRQQEWPPETE
jgi:hypothetical protein